MGDTNLVGQLNQKIFRFVQEPRNCSLMAGTGAYSTPFRGQLFGSSETSAVLQQLATHSVEVLWFGSNPGWQPSIEQIVDRQRSKSDFRDFERQMNSVFFSSRLWDAQGDSRPDWEPAGAWGIYTSVLENVADMKRVTMANFLPWGSKDLKTFVKMLGEFDSGLLQRAVEFADELSRSIVSALQPRLVVVPRSLAENKFARTRRIGLSMEGVSDRKYHPIHAGGKVFKVYSGTCALKGARAVWAPHHAALRLTDQARQQYIEQVSTVLHALLR